MAKVKHGFILYLCSIAAVTAMFSLFIVTHKLVVVSGDSMMPTLHDGEVVVASKATIPVRGRLYVVEEPDDNTLAVKRLIGGPGDTVELRDGATYVNGELCMEQTTLSWDNAVYKLGPDEYLFMGDNRGRSYDGRFWSRPCKLSEIIYELSFRIYPFSVLGEVE